VYNKETGQGVQDILVDGYQEGGSNRATLNKNKYLKIRIKVYVSREPGKEQTFTIPFIIKFKTKRGGTYETPPPPKTPPKQKTPKPIKFKFNPEKCTRWDQGKTGGASKTFVGTTFK
jgi:hypothetical protein